MRTFAGLVAHDLGVHGARVDDSALGRPHVHLGDKRECLVGWSVEERRKLFSLGDPFGV